MKITGIIGTVVINKATPVKNWGRVLNINLLNDVLNVIT